MEFTLKRKERLKSRKIISAIFTSGQHITVFPIKLFWIDSPTSDDTTKIKFGFSIPKKKFKKATDRNRIKRLMFEAVRLNKHIITTNIEPLSTNLALMLLYIGTEKPTFEEIESKVKKCFNRLNEKKI